jgi:hypothetical protein
LRIHLLAHNPNTRAPDTALSLVVQEKIILVLERIALRTMKTLLRKDPNRKNKKAGKAAPMNRPHTETWRTAIISHSPRTKRSSATKISSCLRNLSSRSALNAG